MAQTLPFDILSDIFLQSLPPADDPEADLRLHPTIAPLQLCHVCKSWKIAAFNFRRLWDSAFLPVFYYEEEQSGGVVKILDKKSLDLMHWWKEVHYPTLPSICLALAISREETSLSIPPSEKALLSNTFFQSARRLELRVSAFKLPEAYRHRQPPNHFENLTELRIFHQGASKKLSQDFNIPVFPSLRRLYLPSYHLSELYDRISHLFPWRQLTHVCIPKSMHQDSWRKLMAASPAIVYGAFRVYGWYEQPVADTTMHSVRHLVVSCSELSFQTPLRRIMFPGLESLRIGSLLHNRVISLRALEIMLSTAPSLTELHLDFCLSFRGGSNLPFERPLEGKRLSDITPRLRRFVIDYIDPGDAAVGQRIVQFLQSEWLCSGWETLPGDVTERRRLELVISQRSYFTSSLFCEDIFRDVEAYLSAQADHPAFLVSVSKHASRELMGIEDLEEEIIRRAWTEVVDR